MAEVAARDEEVAAREAEHSRTVSEQKGRLEHLSLVEEYMRQTDPAFFDFIATHSSNATTMPHPTDLPATSPPAS